MDDELKWALDSIAAMPVRPWQRGRTDDDGVFLSGDEYAALLAELTRLTAERDALAAEVARLREAGDAVLGSFGPDEERWFTDEMREALNKLALLVLPDDDAARALVEAPR